MGAATLVLMLVLAQVATPGMPPRPGAPPAADTHPKGTSSIRGRITAADTGRPLRRARVTMTAEPLTTLTTPKSTSTNVRGEYELKDLPAGRYQSSILLSSPGVRRLTATPAIPFPSQCQYCGGCLSATKCECERYCGGGWVELFSVKVCCYCLYSDTLEGVRGLTPTRTNLRSTQCDWCDS